MAFLCACQRLGSALMGTLAQGAAARGLGAGLTSAALWLAAEEEALLGELLVEGSIPEVFGESVSQVPNNALHSNEAANFGFPFFTSGCRRRGILLNAAACRCRGHAPG